VQLCNIGGIVGLDGGHQLCRLGLAAREGQKGKHENKKNQGPEFHRDDCPFNPSADPALLLSFIDGECREITGESCAHGSRITALMLPSGRLRGQPASTNP
jgi:hypothetical protein